MRDPNMTDHDEMAVEWADYRNECGVAAEHLVAAHQAFIAGWEAARGKSHEGRPLR